MLGHDPEDAIEDSETLREQYPATHGRHRGWIRQKCLYRALMLIIREVYVDFNSQAPLNEEQFIVFTHDKDNSL